MPLSLSIPVRLPQLRPHATAAAPAARTRVRRGGRCGTRSQHNNSIGPSLIVSIKRAPPRVDLAAGPPLCASLGKQEAHSFHLANI
jgi:hypothetical protein